MAENRKRMIFWSVNGGVASIARLKFGYDIKYLGVSVDWARSYPSARKIARRLVGLK